MNKRRWVFVTAFIRAVFARWWHIGAGVLTALLIFGLGVITGWYFAGARGAIVPTSAKSVAPLLWQAWNLAEDHYVDTQALQPTRMMYGAISGMLTALGDTSHTRFLTPTEVQQENAELSGHFVGIGIQVNINRGRPVVVAPLPGSPAQKAGIQAGDVILEVNGRDTAQLSLTQLSTEIQGPAGSRVTLLLLRPSTQKTLNLTLTRASIATPALETNQFTVNDTSILDIHLTQFSSNADSELKKALQQGQADHVDGVILDLRDNPGGLLDQSIAVSSEFLTSGVVLIEEGRNGVKHDDTVKPGGVAPKVPLVVLVNQGTASAAEIAAGALKDHQRATIVGTTTFGTGTVLETYSLSDGSELLLGTEEWLTPDGMLIWHHGITPNQTITLPANVNPLYPDAEEHMTGQQITQSSDIQLDQAIRDLTGK